MLKIRDNNYIKFFGENLKKIRLEKKLTQEELEHLSGIDFSQIGRIERGKQNVTICTILVLSNALEIQPKKLLDFEYNLKHKKLT